MVCSKMLPTYKNVAPFENIDLLWTNVFYTLQPDVESKNNGDILSDVKWHYEQMHFRLCSLMFQAKTTDTYYLPLNDADTTCFNAT